MGPALFQTHRHVLLRLRITRFCVLEHIEGARSALGACVAMRTHRQIPSRTGHLLTRMLGTYQIQRSATSGCGGMCAKGPGFGALKTRRKEAAQRANSMIWGRWAVPIQLRAHTAQLCFGQAKSKSKSKSKSKKHQILVAPGLKRCTNSHTLIEERASAVKELRDRLRLECCSRQPAWCLPACVVRANNQTPQRLTEREK